MTLIFICQQTAENSSLGVDTENAKVEKIKIKGMETIYIEKDTHKEVHFHDGQYIFSLSGIGVSRAVLLDIAQSIELQ